MVRPLKTIHFGRRTAIVPAPSGVFSKLKKITQRAAFSGKNSLSVILSATLIFGAFGTLVVRAGDDTGVFDFIKSQARSARVQRQSTLPPIFVPQAAYSRQALGYAPSYNYGYTPRYTPQSIDFDAAAAARKSKKSEVKSSRKRSTAQKRNREAEQRMADNEGLTKPTAYCVRTCDGYYFPIGYGSENFNGHEAACNSVCPSAQTRVYVAPIGSDGIELATHRGQRYSSLTAAYSYRQTRDKSCSCAAGGVGMTSPLPENDQTFRRGDVVMTSGGFRAYAGNNNYPHRKNDFVAASSATKSLSDRERSYLSTLTTGGRRRTNTGSVIPSRQPKMASFKSASIEAREIGKIDNALVEKNLVKASQPKLVRNVAPHLPGTTAIR